MSWNHPSRRRRVLLVDAIRDDIPSGGATATKTLLDILRRDADVHVLSLTPRLEGLPRWQAVLQVIASVPAPLLVVLYRATGWLPLEYILRLSPWLALRCAWTRLHYAPDEVVLNHQAALPFLPMFLGLPATMVWHDLLSRKPDRRGRPRRSRIVLCTERAAALAIHHHLSYSHDEVRVLRRFYHAAARVVPAVMTPPAVPPAGRDNRTLLLVGNWLREENRGGALRFLRAWSHADHAGVAVAFHIAGNGAERFARDLASTIPEPVRRAITFTPRYRELSDFTALAVLAPIEVGAGIKLKTLEAWQAGLPVLGTRQAFTGLPPRIWRRGGLSFPTIEALVAFCADPEAVAVACARLAPAEAYLAYLQLAVPVKN